MRIELSRERQPVEPCSLEDAVERADLEKEFPAAAVPASQAGGYSTLEILK
jgi:hypothetical protein